MGKLIIHRPELTRDLKAEAETGAHVPAAAEGPGAVQLVVNAGGALMRGIRSGFAKVDADTLAGRQAICAGCKPYWEPEAFFGKGRCRLCGCSGLKLHLAAERCPAGKWEAVKTD